MGVFEDWQLIDGYEDVCSANKLFFCAWTVGKDAAVKWLHYAPPLYNLSPHHLIPPRTTWDVVPPARQGWADQVSPGRKHPRAPGSTWQSPSPCKNGSKETAKSQLTGAQCSLSSFCEGLAVDMVQPFVNWELVLIH